MRLFRYAEQLFVACILVLAVFMLVGGLVGCESQAIAEKPVVVTVASPAPAPSCPCGDKCECAELKKEVERLKGEVEKKEAALTLGAEKYAELERKVATQDAIYERWQNNANVIGEEFEKVKSQAGDPVQVNGVFYRNLGSDQQYYDAHAQQWKSRPKPVRSVLIQPAMNAQRYQFQPMHGRRMKSCGPNGCPTF